MYRVSRRERPADRNDLDEVEKANTDQDPWSFQYHAATGKQEMAKSLSLPLHPLVVIAPSVNFVTRMQSED